MDDYLKSLQDKPDCPPKGLTIQFICLWFVIILLLFIGSAISCVNEGRTFYVSQLIIRIVVDTYPCIEEHPYAEPFFLSPD
jgi:hypothetical protein